MEEQRIPLQSVLSDQLEKWTPLRLKFMFKLFYFICSLIIENEIKIDYVVKC